MKKLNEKSLNRVRDHSLAHDTGYITAFRGNNIKKINLINNKRLRALLQSMGYGITSVIGGYIEDYGTSKAKEVGEKTYFVVDLKDGGKLRKHLVKLGEEFEQDSVLFVYKGGEKSELIGTNNAEFPGYHKVKKSKNAIFGKSGEFLTKVKGRPYIFENKNNTNEIKSATNIMGQRACYITAQQLKTMIDKIKKRML